MNPRGVMPVQAVILAIAIGALAFSSAPVTEGVLTGVLALVWVALDADYAWRLNGRTRKDTRVAGDHWVAREVIGVVVVCIVALAARVGFGIRFWSSSALTVGAVAVASFWLSAFAACLVDWYYIRSRRDGVVVEPPCRTSGYQKWNGVTRVWYLHRSIVVIVGAIAAVVASVAFGLAALGGTHGSDALKVGSLLVAGAGAALALTRLFYGGLASVGDILTACCFSGPDVAIGEKLVGGGDSFVQGYVRDVALEGITVVLLDGQGRPVKGPEGHAQTKRHGLTHILDKPDVRGVPFSPCIGGCCLVNSDCQWQAADWPSPRTKSESKKSESDKSESDKSESDKSGSERSRFRLVL